MPSAVTICFPFVGDLVGGSHISASSLIAKIDQQRYAPLVIVQNPQGIIARLFADRGIAVEAIPASISLQHGRRVGPLRALELARGAIPLARFLRKRQVAIVHSNDGRTHATWALAARLAGAQLLWHHRGAPDALGLRMVAPLLANRVVAVSHFAGDQAGGLRRRLRTDVVHSPFDTSIQCDRWAARQAILELINAPPTANLVGFSGVLIDRKRPLLFVDAIAALRRVAPELDARGVLFGAFWLAGCDLLMVPAIDEPFGRTLIEAMLVETPVVATASGGNVEAIRDRETGRLVPPEDAQALADACATLLRDPAMMEGIGQSARADALLKFGEARHADAIMAIYDDMLHAGAGQETPHR
jgi:glycosyltransferase involved in cell wall biosynthesis